MDGKVAAKKRKFYAIVGRLKGKNLDEINAERRRHDNVWYSRYDQLTEMLVDGTSPGKILDKVHSMCDRGAYKRNHIAMSAKKDIQLIKMERGL